MTQEKYSTRVLCDGCRADITESECWCYDCLKHMFLELKKLRKEIEDGKIKQADRKNDNR